MADKKDDVKASAERCKGILSVLAGNLERIESDSAKEKAAVKEKGN